MMVSTRRAIHFFHIKAASMSRNAEIKSSVAPLQRRFSDKSEEKVRNLFRYNARQTINSRRPAVLSLQGEEDPQ
jgi:hypothetical protein